MTDRTSPVADTPTMDLLTQWRQWADRYESVDDPNEAERIIDDLTASIQANIPAPPSSIPDSLREIAEAVRTSTSVHNDEHMTDRSRDWLRDLARRIGTEADRVEREMPLNKSVSDSLAAVERAVGVSLDAPTAPPKSLVDELREVAKKLDRQGAVDPLPSDVAALANRVEAIEAGNERLRVDAEQRQAWNQKITDENATLTRERDDARAELDKLKFETLDGLTAIGWMEDAKSARVEMERMARKLEWWDSTVISGAVTATTTVREGHRDD